MSLTIQIPMEFAIIKVYLISQPLYQDSTTNNNVPHQSHEGRLNVLLLPLVPLVERNLLRVGNEPRVDVAEVPLQTLLRDRQAADWAAQVGQQCPRDQQVKNHDTRGLRKGQRERKIRSQVGRNTKSLGNKKDKSKLTEN